MKFAEMLMQEVQPLPNTRGPTRHKRPNTWSNPAMAISAKKAKALAKYREGVTTEWSTAPTIARRMDMGRNDIFKQLVNYAKEGILEQRPAGGGAFNRRKGWEWRVK